MPKHIAICSDGTWNTADQQQPTNVVHMARAIAPAAADGTPQVVFYDAGVGTSGFLDRWTGGAFGHGLDKNIADAYRFIVLNYEEGDKLFLFGFSRGAYTIRSLAGLIRNIGLLHKIDAELFPQAYDLYRRRDPNSHPDADESRKFRQQHSREIEVHFMGVWDTVGSLGIPLRGLRFLTRRKYQFHDVTLSRSVRHAYHAVAIDERRGPFEATLWDGDPKPGQLIEQAWFAGVHSNVGGGYTAHQLSDIACLWMVEKAKACGLGLDAVYSDRFMDGKFDGILHNSMTGLYRFTLGHVRRIGQFSTESIHETAMRRHGTPALNYQPRNLQAYLRDRQPKVEAGST